MKIVELKFIEINNIGGAVSCSCKHVRAKRDSSEKVKVYVLPDVSQDDCISWCCDFISAGGVNGTIENSYWYQGKSKACSDWVAKKSKK